MTGEKTDKVGWTMMGDGVYFLTALLLLLTAIIFYLGAIYGVTSNFWYLIIGFMTGLSLTIPTIANDKIKRT
jgi:hypothetical protein